VTSALAGIEPALVWARFGELTRIPRPPRGESEVRRHVLAWAGQKGLESAVDAAGNIVVRVPAAAGREDAATVVLQSHLDMVCERDPESPHDPRAGRIHVARAGDWVVADGTTLGADNGIGVAAALALAEDPGVAHGPLELLFTVCEEEGLEGAKALDPSLITGRLLVNLDGTSEDAVTVGCAGSAHTFVRVALERDGLEAGHVCLRVAVSGGRGGHSGADIARGRANAIQVLGRILRAAPETMRLVRLSGGVSRNAIPREGEAVVALPGTDEGPLREAAERTFRAIREEYAATDGDLRLAIDPMANHPSADERSTRQVLDLLAAIPTGVIAMSEVAPDTVETSTSLNVASTDDGVVTLASMSRSADRARLDSVVATIEGLARKHAAGVEVKRSYAPWEPDLDSRLLAIARATYERVLGTQPELEIVHGGLECAVLGSKLPGIEMIALGPRIEGPHAPGERVSIASVQRFYPLLGALLDDLSR
jgi:dipeptidase D